MKNADFSSEESKSCVNYAIFNGKFLDCLKLPYVTPVHKKCFFLTFWKESLVTSAVGIWNDFLLSYDEVFGKYI